MAELVAKYSLHLIFLQEIYESRRNEDLRMKEACGEGIS